MTEKPYEVVSTELTADGLTPYQQLALIKALTGKRFHLGQYEEITGCVISDAKIVLVVGRVKFSETRYTDRIQTVYSEAWMWTKTDGRYKMLPDMPLKIDGVKTFDLYRKVWH
jgi:hypothetical protein